MLHNKKRHKLLKHFGHTCKTPNAASDAEAKACQVGPSDVADETADSDRVASQSSPKTQKLGQTVSIAPSANKSASEGAVQPLSPSNRKYLLHIWRGTTLTHPL